MRWPRGSSLPSVGKRPLNFSHALYSLDEGWIVDIYAVSLASLQEGVICAH